MKKHLQINAFVRLIMRVSLLQIFLLTSLISISYAKDTKAQILEKKITLALENSTLRNALSKIEKETDARFLYHSQIFSSNDRITLKASNESLERILNKIFGPYGITYEADGNQIILTKNLTEDAIRETTNAWTGVHLADVTGTVTDETGAGFPGVNVIVKGTSNGTITDNDGKYTISATAESILVFTFVGYTAQEVTVGDRTSIDVKMVVNTNSLDEVVVIGYGEEKKSLVTGAISSVKADQIKSISYGTMDRALQGRMAGVNVMSTSGQPGAGMKIMIRGTGSNRSSDPLYIVDGVRIPSGGGIEYLNPSDIASIEVLKDAASAAIYGAEGANGVIIVSTKTGKTNSQPEITYSGQYSVQSVKPNTMPMMNATQYQQYLEEAGTANAPTTADVTDAKGTNWLKELFKSAPTQNHNISFNGGNETSNYSVSAGYYNQKGIVGGDKSFYERYSFRINSDHKVKKWLTIGEKVSYVVINRNGISEDSEFGGFVSSAISLDPLTPVAYTGAVSQTAQNALDAGYTLIKNGAGQYYGISQWVQGEYGNPLARIDITKGKTNQNKIVGSFYTDLNLLPGLKFTSRFGIDAAFERRHDWTPLYYFNLSNLNTLAQASDAWQSWFNWQWENFATYNKSFGNHNITVLGGLSLTKRRYNQVGGSYAGLFRQNEEFSYANNVPDGADRIYSGFEVRTLSSQFARVAYDYKNTYQFNATIRRDGSSMLADGHQWGVFPSVSAGWVLSNENFMAPTAEFLTFAKVRASWGQNGSIANLQPGLWKASYSTNDVGVIRYPDATGNFQFGAAQTQLENPLLKWETSEQLDIGLDLKFLRNQISFTVDYFNKNTKDLITGGAPPGFLGLGLPAVNSGNILNRGFEFELGYQSITQNSFQWGISGNLTTLHNEVTKVNAVSPVLPGTGVGTGWTASYLRKGEPVWGFNGYKTNGIFQDQEQIDNYVAANNLTGYAPKPGDPIVLDTNKDGTISVGDQTYIGNPLPKMYFGTRLTAAYKGFDLLVFLQGQVGNKILMGFVRTDRPTANKPAFFYNDRWTPENRSNTWFAASTNNPLVYNSDKMVFNGSYARIRQLQLGYTLPKELSSSIGVKNARFYVSLDNFFTFTKYKGLDPESGSGNVQSLGIDRGVYPIPRTVMGGVSVTF